MEDKHKMAIDWLIEVLCGAEKASESYARHKRQVEAKSNKDCAAVKAAPKRNAKPTKAKPKGRPRRLGANPQKFNLYLSRSDYNALMRLSRETGVGRLELIRRALRHSLDSRKHAQGRR